MKCPHGYLKLSYLMCQSREATATKINRQPHVSVIPNKKLLLHLKGCLGQREFFVWGQFRAATRRLVKSGLNLSNLGGVAGPVRTR